MHLFSNFSLMYGASQGGKANDLRGTLNSSINEIFTKICLKNLDKMCKCDVIV